MLLALLRRHLAPHRLLLVGVVVFQLAQSVASLFLPTLNADIIDEGVAKGDTRYILVVGGVMLLVAFAQILCAIIAVYFGSKASMGLGRDLRAALFARVSAFSEREVARFGPPSLITRNTNDVQQVQMLVFISCTLLVTAPMLAIGGIVMALQQDVALSLIVVIAIPVLLVVVSLILWRVVPRFRRMQAMIDRVNRILREQLSGIRIVRAFVREREETRRFDEANRDLTRLALVVGRFFTVMFPTVMLVMNGSTVAVLWFGAFRIDDGTMQLGSLFAFLVYIMQILGAVMMVTFMAILVPRASVCAERISEVLETRSTVLPPEHAAPAPEPGGAIGFHDVGFRYPGAERPVLHGVDFRVEPGTTTAIVGSTGAGKTTLARLVPRLFDVTEGVVTVGGADVAALEPETLWSRIGLVPQRAYLFSGTVASNLRFGDPEADDEALWAALEIAQARDFVEAMPGGLEAPIAQGGANVSGGQRQRLAIARALVKRPEIYVFDDSFSALDLATDARLRAALRREIDATFLIVAQRLSTVADAEQIVVLDAGSVVGVGTHAELLEDCVVYAEIASSQLSPEEAG